MSCARTAFLLAFATGLTAIGIAAESSVPPADASQAPPILATPSAPPTAPAPQRAVSSETAAKLAATGPKFVAAPPAGESFVSTVASVAPNDVARPRNTIIRLPEYVVRDAKIPSIKPREVMTPHARLDVAFKRHPGLKIGNLWNLNAGWALFMLAEEERLERKREFEDLVGLTRFSNPTTHATAKREVERAFNREPDFGR